MNTSTSLAPMNAPGLLNRALDFRFSRNVMALAVAMLAAGQVLFAGPMAFTNSPQLWTVKGGVYRYAPTVSNTGLGPVTLTAVEKPAWLSFDGTLLSGMAPDDREGLNDLVILRASNADPATEDLSFRIRVGRLVGPVPSPLGGGMTQWVTGMPQVARTGGDSLLVTGVARASEFPVFWGLLPNGFGMKMNYVGPSGSGGQDFTPPPNPFSPAEIGQWNAANSSIPGGIGVLNGLTNRPASIGGAAVSTWLRMEVRDIANTTALPLKSADELGLNPSVGALGRITNTGDLRVAMRLHANAVFPSGTAALDWFNSLTGKLATDRAITEVSSGFYWVNTPPRLSTNAGLAMMQDGVAVLNTGNLNAADSEDLPTEVRFELTNGTGGGPPMQGSLQTDQAGTWVPLAAGQSFTLAQLSAGKVRYVHGGSYNTSDGFQFRVWDAQNTFARDGNFSIFTFPISITRRNHPCLADNQTIPAGLGSTVTGQLSFSDPDIGFLPQTFQFTHSSSPSLGTFTITDPATGSFSYVAGQTPGNETISWQVSDGEFNATATLTLQLANQNPSATPLSLSGSSAGPLVGTVTVTDPDLPAQTIALSLNTPPSKGTVQFTGLQIAYTPNPGRFGSDSFTFIATDSLGGVSTPQTVTISVRPATLGAEAVFVSARLSGSAGNEGVVQRLNPANGDVYTLGRNLGSETRGIIWAPSLEKLLVLLEADDGGSPIRALVKIDPHTGAWTMADIITMNDNLVFPIGLALDGPNHVLIANGPGGVVRVDLQTGAQTVLALGLPAGVFVTSAVPSPVDPAVIWVTNFGDFGIGGDGALFACNRNSANATSPVALSPAGDPGSLALDGDSGLVVARTGVPAEKIALSPLGYTPHPDGFPAAPWSLPVSIAKSTVLNQWLVTDPFQAKLFSQSVDSTLTHQVVAGDLAAVFAVTTVVKPVIVVQGPSASPIVNGQTVLAGEAVTGETATVSFTISNSGLDVLGLTGPSPNLVQVGNPSAFSVTSQPLGTVTVGGFTTFQIAFSPSTAGVHTTTVTIGNTDVDSDPFTFTLQSTGITPRERFDDILADAGLTGPNGEPNATPYGDGVANLVKYAFNMRLDGPDSGRMISGGTAGLPATQWLFQGGNTVLRVEFLRRIGSGVQYTPQKSQDMAPGNWQPFTSSPVRTPVDSDWERVVYLEPLAPGNTRWFSRVVLNL